MSFTRSTIPVTLLFASIGFVFFGLMDAAGGKLFTQFVDAPGLAILLSALLGATIGYAIGWSVIRKYRLPHSATPYDVDAAARTTQNSES